MDVLLCAACGRRPAEPVRRLDEMSEPLGRHGLPGPDGLRPARSVPDAVRAVAA
ncbi:hypothetical protein A6P39_014365 [Streptomyces sp. FXJ1.172]|uniref:hypothetical protein n=1 Tax=Streptomyces sp. FXJ1.172 TaxID=710705 RepID=UPI000AB7E497|nr:hypothetical protein [Streptomyces sp. FXJ1.172]WEO95103.1 hypothetical protein A6P39_014365 [Streptomyces sp. FXJ1.172]